STSPVGLVIETADEWEGTECGIGASNGEGLVQTERGQAAAFPRAAIEQRVQPRQIVHDLRRRGGTPNHSRCPRPGYVRGLGDLPHMKAEVRHQEMADLGAPLAKSAFARVSG